MSFDWTKLNKDLKEEMEDIIKRYQMFSKEHLEVEFKDSLEEFK